MEYSNEFIIKENLRGFDLTFKTTYDLFSYQKIDEGTKLLINTIELIYGQTCLDLGCGYGAIGIAMAKLNPQGIIYMVDRDFVAVKYAKINCGMNNVSNPKVLLSDGFSNLQKLKFDVIASNLPTHIAKESLIKMISDSKDNLKKNGSFYIVCTFRLKSFIQKLLVLFFKNSEILAHNQKYVIILAVKN